ncbi:MAG: hypothetical protein HON98_09975 [Chloroflexi bacterium]|jgi:hypothetical protein|nr:hypothetical protein [Chloroflexota bacterium]MBT3670870.1 hypothetical protein [Chloroflexota bacterium]MBT4003678.1 hypothetical protein [Chloroflexota bacterium]MBT4305183.1 hypothetical protein [Chloroflexota bacterium]MBT4534582.1 hypothetical protein [Chloroflexota bacterium]
MFTNLIIYIITPLLLLAILLSIGKLIRAEREPEEKMRVIIGSLVGGMIGILLMATNRQYFHFDYWSFDPFVLILSRNLTILLFIAISALIAYFVLAGIDQLMNKGLKSLAATAYAAVFIFIIYLAYYRLALEAVAVFIITGFIFGIGLKKLVDTRI